MKFVHCDARTFGDVEGIIDSVEYLANRMLAMNHQKTLLASENQQTRACLIAFNTCFQIPIARAQHHFAIVFVMTESERLVGRMWHRQSARHRDILAAVVEFSL